MNNPMTHSKINKKCDQKPLYKHKHNLDENKTKGKRSSYYFNEAFFSPFNKSKLPEVN